MCCLHRLFTTAVHGVKSDVKILPEPFCGLHEGSRAVHRLKVIVVLPRCSSSALNDPVPVIHGEHGGELGASAG